jgi:hypothetical protein
MMRFLWVVIGTIVISTSAACMPLQHATSTVIATSGIPSVSAPPPAPQAVIGSTLQVTTSTTAAAYTVANLRQAVPSNEYVTVQGTLMAVDVIVQTQSGTVPVNVNYFHARTEDGTQFDTFQMAMLPGQLTFGDLPQGQKLRGVVAFDIPPGQTIAQIVLSGPIGSQDGLWTVS